MIGSKWPELWSSKHLHIHMVYTVSNHILMALYSIIILHTIHTYYNTINRFNTILVTVKKLRCSLDERVNKVRLKKVLPALDLVNAICDNMVNYVKSVVV